MKKEFSKSNSGWQYIEKENLLHVLFEEEFSEEEAKKYSHYFRPLKLGYQQWLALAVLKFRRNGIQSRNEIPFLYQLYLDITGQVVKVNGTGFMVNGKPVETKVDGTPATKTKATSLNPIKRVISKFI